MLLTAACGGWPGGGWPDVGSTGALLGPVWAVAALPEPVATRRRTATQPPPNLVLILCDDLGYGDISCYGHSTIRTPCLDRLAAEGLRLTDCYAAAPVCSPARAGLVTGRAPYRAGIRDWIPPDSAVHLRDDEPSVARLLKSAGYATAHLGKWHLSGTLDGTQPTPGDHGFDHWFSTQNNAAPSHRNPVNFVRNGQPVGPLEGYSQTLIVDEAIRFLESIGPQPFLLFVWFHAPHEPVAAPEELTSTYDEADPTRNVYYGSVTLIDQQVGRLVDYLDETRGRQQTLIFFTSDNGPETHGRYRGAQHSHGSTGGLRGRKLHLHEGGTRVPGILRWPGQIAAGRTSDEPVSGVDVLPTFCELAAVPLSRELVLDGTSLVPLLTGQPLDRRQPLYWQYDRALEGEGPAADGEGALKFAIRDGPWKLLTDAIHSRYELYHLSVDPQEEHDLAQAMPERLTHLKARLRALRAEIDDEQRADFLNP